MTEDNADLIAGRYQLVERIGQGGMGRVWRGTDRQLFGREVAIKEILFPPGLEESERTMLLRRFTGEARAAVTLNHPGIITVHDVVEHNGAPVIVMEFVRGRSLAAAIRDEGRLSVRRVAEIGAAMLGALAEAHAAGIVHRDIKPDNVLLTKDRVVLTDFGIAHLADVSTKLSHSGIVIGTPQYMPPEQLEGKRPTPANDLWALGATLYHAVEGRPPFDAEGLHALAVAVFTRPHRPPTEAGPLVPVLDALLTKDPARRASAAEAAELLSAVLRDPGPTPSGTPRVPPAPEPSTPVPPMPARLPAPTAPDAGAVPGPSATPLAAVPPPSTPVPAPPATPPSGNPYTAPPSGNPYTAPPSGSPYTVPPSGSPYTVLPTGNPYTAPPTGNPYTAPAPVDSSATAPSTAPSGASPWGDGGGLPTPVTDRPPDSLAAGRPRRPAARRIAAAAVALATLAGGGILAWTLTHNGTAGGAGGTAGSGATGGGSSGTPAQAGGDSAATTTVVIGVEAPLSGSLSALGLGIKNSADLAVKKANRTHEVPGVTFEVQALDDQALPANGQQNAARLVADGKVLGVVGPLNSSVAQAMLGALDQAGLAEVSPANTNPVLSQGPDWAKGAKSRPHPSYFRTVTTDAVQGPYAAQYLYQDARKTRLFVIDDNGTYGSGLAAAAGSQFSRLGGTVVGTEHVKPDDRDFSALAAKVAAAGADAVYYGGEYPAAAPLSQQLKQAGVNVPLMGGDGIYAAEFIGVNTKAEGDLATAVGASADLLSGGKIFLADYRAAGYPQEAGPYGAYAYDAAWSVIESVKAVVAANGGTLPADARAKVTKAMAAVAFDGVTGRVDFDEYGDTLNRQITVYSVKGGAWTPVRTGSYKP